MWDVRFWEGGIFSFEIPELLLGVETCSDVSKVSDMGESRGGGLIVGVSWRGEIRHPSCSPTDPQGTGGMLC